MSKRVNRDDVDKFHDYGIYLPSRTIYMGSESHDVDSGESGVDGAMAEKMVKNLHVLDSINKEPILIIMNNTGGDEYHGFAIYDAIQACASHVTIKVYGHAMSMGSIILQAADHRVMMPTSRMMIHYGTWGVHDHAKTAQKWAEEGRKIDTWMEDMYLSRIHEKVPGFTKAKLQKMLDHDTFFTAQETVDLGLADKVDGQTEEET